MNASGRARLFFLSLCLTTSSSLLFAQFFPNGNPAEVRNAILDSNNVSLVMYNYGQYMRPSTLCQVADFTWRNLGHMFEFGPLLAAKVVNNNGDTLRIIDDGMWLPSQGGYAPDGSIKWGWLPRAGYAQPNQPYLASSNNPQSWPTSWASWPGEDGPGIVRGLVETFYAMDDFTNKEFPYYPFPSDTNARGLGVSAEVRTYQFGGNLSDGITVRWKLKNESPQPLPECYFGFYGDPHIGGCSDFSDDLARAVPSNGPAGYPEFSFARNTVNVWDADGLGQGGLPAGYLNFKFLETPNDSDLTTLYVMQYTNSLPNVPKNRPLTWQMLSTYGIDTNQTLMQNPGDNVLFFGTGPFSLAAGDSTYVSLAIFCSENYIDMLEDATYVHFAQHWPNISGTTASQGGNPAYAIQLTSPGPGVISGSVPITWQYAGSDQNARVLIEYSWDRGTRWRPLVWDHPVGQPYTWNTANGRDGVNYLLRIVAHSNDLASYYYDVSDARFTVDNPGNAKPELEFDPTFAGSVIRHSPLTIQWTAEDADNTNVNITVLVSNNQNGPFTTIHSSLHSTGTNSFPWDFSAFPNAPSYFVRVIASDGSLDTMLTSGSFEINQWIGQYPDTTIQHVAGISTASILLNVIDPTQLSGNTYELTFNVVHQDSLKKMNLRNMTTSAQVFSDLPLYNGTSTPLFDGLKLLVNDTPTDVNLTKSIFNRSELDPTVNYDWTEFPTLMRTKVPLDWYIAFNSLDTLPNGKYAYPGDTVLNNAQLRVVVCPFYIRNIDSMQPGHALASRTLGDSMWRPGRPLILRPQPPIGIQVSYQVNMNFTPTLRPTFGDTLWIITDKGIASSDTFMFTADSTFVVGVKEGAVLPVDYSLSQNYPNPFNPSTTIKYQIPNSNFVSLQVFDILGREVRTLLNEQQIAGVHEVTFDANGLASGIYFYRLTAGSFVHTRKLVLLR
ncbi:MAG TPA: T9SS type A sorting domain-containing protein [Bacteroidota bacterium]